MTVGSHFSFAAPNNVPVAFASSIRAVKSNPSLSAPFTEIRHQHRCSLEKQIRVREAI
jgi:hypothetical protein